MAFSLVEVSNIFYIRYDDIPAENSVYVIYRDRHPNNYQTPNSESEHCEL